MLVKRWSKFGGSRGAPNGYWLSETVAYLAVSAKKYLCHIVALPPFARVLRGFAILGTVIIIPLSMA